MLRRTNTIPLDYSLCAMTVTVYDRHGGRRVLRGVHYEFTDSLQVEAGQERCARQFLLVAPGGEALCPGDVVVPGEGPQRLSDAPLYDRLGVVATVKQRYFRGSLCHTEARGTM